MKNRFKITILLILILVISITNAAPQTADLSISAMYELGNLARMRIIGYDLKENIEIDQGYLWSGNGTFETKTFQIPKSVRSLLIENDDEGILVLDYFYVNNIYYDGIDFIAGNGCSQSITDSGYIANCTANSWIRFELENGNPVRKKGN